MAREQEFKARDKKTQRMTKDGLVEVNQTTGEQERISLRGAEFQLRQGKSAPETVPLREQSHAGRARQQVRPEAFQQENATNTDQRLDIPTAGTNFSSPHTDRLPRQASDVPVTSSPGHSFAHTDSGARPYHAEGGRLREDAHRPDTPTPEHWQSDSGYYQQFQETPTATPERPGRLRFDAGTPPSTQGKQRQNGSKYARKFTQDSEPNAQPAAPDSAPADTPATDNGAPASGDSPTTAPDSGTAHPPSKKSSRLQFDVEELPPSDMLDRKTSKLQGKIGKTDAKLKKAQEHLPTKRKMRTERTFNTEKGKPQRKIIFEQEVKSQRAHLKGELPTRPVKAGVGAVAGFAHGKVHQVEQENVEMEAAHKGELIAESAARRAYRQHKTAPYRRVEKLSRLSGKQHVKLTYQEALRDNPKLRSNTVSRFIQKQKIKRQYAKTARDTKRAAQAAKKAGTAAVGGGKAIAAFASQHPATFGVVALILLLMLVIMSTFGSCTNMAGSVLSAVLSGSYVAEDGDIDNSELSYTDWETELQMQIDNVERDHGGYDEYRFDLDEIGHDPYEPLAYLTSKYQDYTFAEVQGELRAIFAEQYTLEFVEEVEIRYYEDEDGDEVPYEWYILNINLTTKPLADILASRMDDDQKEIFDTLMTSKGNRQYSISPLGFDWLPNVTCNYGWRIHPISGERDFHNAVDIGIPEGTPILAGHDGRVVTASYDADGYGWYVTLEGDKGLSTRYAHCNSLLVSVGQEVEKGETIAKSGNTGNSTGPHLHFEVRMNGQTLNPLFFAVTSGEERE